MKVIRYSYNGNDKEMDWNEMNEQVAIQESDDGCYRIEDDDRPDPADTPTELEAIDARLTYVEMMTGLLEV